MKSKVFRKRRLRRQNKAALRHGKKAKPTHRLKSGRTGKVFSKKLASRRATKVNKKVDKLHASNKVMTPEEFMSFVEKMETAG